jgi:DNA processing protein
VKELKIDRHEWLALSLVPGLGNVGFRQLLEAFGSVWAIFKAGEAELVSRGRIRKDIARRIASKVFSSDPELEYMRTCKAGARIIVFEEEQYPSRLKEIADPPMVLYAKGVPIPEKRPLVAVVGSRMPTFYGTRSAASIAEGLAAAGVGVVSGLARGIDTAAHNGCLKAKGFTIAVMGTGIDKVYPESNRSLFETIAGTGCIITEFPTGTAPEGKNFPRRNRIISGLSLGVVVVEAAGKSGSLITAAAALEQGREVFAVPGSIQSPKSAGAHFLLKNGAALVERSDDILAALGIGPGVKGTAHMESGKDRCADISSLEKPVYDAVESYPVHIDAIIEKVRMEPGRVLGVLLEMELKGLLKQLPGKMFVRAG